MTVESSKRSTRQLLVVPDAPWRFCQRTLHESGRSANRNIRRHARLRMASARGHARTISAATFSYDGGNLDEQRPQIERR
jgi:hypothetical protein